MIFSLNKYRLYINELSLIIFNSNYTMKKVTIALCFLIFSLFLYGQSPNTYSTDVKEIVPNSPNASEFEKYGNVSTGLFTGTVQQTIPLYSIKDGNISLPITLDYSSNGVLIDKYESHVGMDWSINYGGVINRKLNDKPDETCRAIFPEAPYTFNDYRLSPLLTDDCVDFQPDIFTLIVNGYTAKFFLDINNNIIFVEPTLIKIEILDNFFIVDNIENPDFVVTTPDGTKYWFGGNKSTETGFSRVDIVMSGWSSPPSIPYKMSWYLSKIEKNNRVIDFYYKKTNLNRLTSINQSIRVIKSNYYQYPEHTFPSITKTTFSESFLDSIKWSSGKIVFEGSNRINSFSVLDFKNNLVKKMQFEYTNVNSDPSFKNSECTYCDSNTIRYFLSGIKNIDIENENNFQQYSFDYYSPVGLPPRLSYARDHWGYFNGKHNTNLIPKDLNYGFASFNSEASQEFNPGIANILLKNVSGNREADDIYGYKGLLRKITYPTKGYTEISYEPHSVYKDKKYYTYLNKSLAVNSINSFNNSSEITFNCIEDQVVQFNNISVGFVAPNSNEDEWGCGENTNEYPFDVQGTLNVHDDTTNSLVSLTNSVLYFTPIDNNFSGSNNIVYALLEKDHQYTIKLILHRPCLQMTANFDLIDNVQIQNELTPIGGMRVLKIDNYDGLGNVYTENLKYGDFNCVQCQGDYNPPIQGVSFYTHNSFISTSTNVSNNIDVDGDEIDDVYEGNEDTDGDGIANFIDDDSDGDGLFDINESIADVDGDGIPNYIDADDFDGPNPDPNYEGYSTNSGGGNNNGGSVGSNTELVEKYHSMIISSNTFNESFVNNTSHISYPIVIKYFNNNFGKGAVKSTFNTQYDGFPQVVKNDLILGTSFSNKYGNGFLAKEQVYDSNLNMKSEIEYQYEKDSTYSNVYYGYNLSTSANYLKMDSALGASLIYIDFNINKYAINSNWYYLKSKIEREFYENSVIENTTNYFYLDPTIPTLSYTETQNSSSQTLKSKFYYSIDLHNSGQIIDNCLIDNNISGYPLKIETFKNGSLVSENKKEFIKDNTTCNLCLLKNEYSRKGGNDLPIEKLITYDKYDIYGNILQYTLENGIPVAFIWGYNQTQPVAKIEGISYDNIPSELISNIQSVTNNTSSSDTQILISLQSLRNAPNLVNTMITTYTYKPLIGISSVTDPKGDTQYYEYDEFNRLKYVKDKEGNILSKNEYHYQIPEE